MNRLNSILGGIAVIAIAIVFVLSFKPPGSDAVGPRGPDCAAEVRSSCVKASHFRATLGLKAGRMSEEQIRGQLLRQSTLDGLIERELLLAEAKRLGISVSDDEVTKELRAGRIRVSVPAKYDNQQDLVGLVPNIRFNDSKTGKFSPDIYKRVVTELSRMSEAEFRDFQKSEIIAERIRDLIRSRADVSEAEAKDTFSRSHSTRTVQYVKFERLFFADNVLKTDDASVEAWAKEKEHADQIAKIFESQRKDFTECRMARHILVKVDPMAANITEEKKKAQDKLAGLKKKIADGASFEEVAKENSEDPSAKTGGDLGCLLKGRGLKAIDDTLFSMTKDGDVSDPIETGSGYELVKLVAIKKGKEAEDVGFHAAAKQIYLGEESNRLASDASKEVIAAVQGGKTLDAALKAYLDKSLPKKPAKKVDDKKDADKKADDKKDADKPKKADDKGKKADDKKDADADKKADSSDDDLTPEHMPMIETSGAFSVVGEAIPGAVAGEDSAGVAFRLKEPGEVAPQSIILDKNIGYAVMVLKTKAPVTDEMWAEHRNEEITNTRVLKEKDALVAYVRRLRKDAEKDIKIYPDVVEDPAERAKRLAGSASAGAPVDKAPVPKDEPTEEQ